MRITESQLRRIIRQEVARVRVRRVNEGRYGGYGYADTYGEALTPTVTWSEQDGWLDEDGMPIDPNRADLDYPDGAVDGDSGVPVTVGDLMSGTNSNLRD